MQTYEISPSGDSIKCLRCGRTSFLRGDVTHLYCGACGYHDTPFTSESVIGAPVPSRGPSPPVRSPGRRG